MALFAPPGDPASSATLAGEDEAGALARLHAAIDARLDAVLDTRVARLIDDRLQEETERRGWRRYGEVF